MTDHATNYLRAILPARPAWFDRLYPYDGGAATVTICDLVEIDRNIDLAVAAVVEDAILESDLCRWKPIVPKEMGFLFWLISESVRAGPGARGGWWGWTMTVRAVRRLLSEPRPHQVEKRMPLAIALHLVGVYKWAPPIARQACPGRQPLLNILVRSYSTKRRYKSSLLSNVKFWSELASDSANHLFIKDGAEAVQPVPSLPGLVCGSCGRLNPRTPTGKLPTRVMCSQCQKKKENAAWKMKDLDRARQLWREATNAKRRRDRGGDDFTANP